MHFAIQIDQYLAPFWTPFGVLLGSQKRIPSGAGFCSEHKEIQWFWHFGVAKKDVIWDTEMSASGDPFELHLGVLLGSFGVPCGGMADGWD